MEHSHVLILEVHFSNWSRPPVRQGRYTWFISSFLLDSVYAEGFREEEVIRGLKDLYLVVFKVLASLGDFGI